MLLSLVIGLVGWAGMVAKPELKGKEVKYMAGDIEMIGYLVLPADVTASTPTVLVVHEWWGQNDYPRKRAHMLAEMGYIAFAVDMYGDRMITEHPKEARGFTREVFSSAKNVAVRFDAATEAVVKHSPAQADNLAAIGYCFGGSVVLEMARQGKDLKAIASFHGGLITPTTAKPGVVKARIFVAHGSADPMTKQTQMEQFIDEMRVAEVDMLFRAYDGARHGFTNPAADMFAKRLNFTALGYDKEADVASWAELDRFLKETFK